MTFARLIQRFGDVVTISFAIGFSSVVALVAFGKAYGSLQYALQPEFVCHAGAPTVVEHALLIARTAAGVGLLFATFCVILTAVYDFLARRGPSGHRVGN